MPGAGRDQAGSANVSAALPIVQLTPRFKSSAPAKPPMSITVPDTRRLNRLPGCRPRWQDVLMGSADARYFGCGRYAQIELVTDSVVVPVCTVAISNLPEEDSSSSAASSSVSTALFTR